MSNTQKRIIPIVKAESLIPRGVYCYERLERKANDPLAMRVVGACPFHNFSTNHISFEGFK